MKAVPALGITGALMLGPGAVTAEPEQFRLDPEHATVAFMIEHVGYAGKTLGTFTDVSGTFLYDEASSTLSDLQVIVQTASVSTHHDKRDEHVRSKDFLAVEEFPQMTFTAAGDTVLDDGKAAVIEGDLSLRGKSRPVTLEATLNKSADYPFGHKLFTLGASAIGTIERSDYDMTYGVAEALVGDTVELIVEIEANRQ